MNSNSESRHSRRWMLNLLAWVALSLAAGEAYSAPKPKLTISKAVWSIQMGTGMLTVSGMVKGGTVPVTLYDGSGRLLAGPKSPDSKHRFAFMVDNPDRLDLLCSVVAKSGPLADAKLVSKPPNPACAKTPLCKIITPSSAITVQANTDVDFEAMVPMKGKAAKNLRLEWDFAGGAMGEDDSKNAAVDSYKRPNTTKTKVKFIRDNSRYRVRFSAMNGSAAGMEGFQQRCEDSVEIIVGTLPTDVPDMTAMVKAAQDAAPKLTKDANGNPTANKGDLVVLPYEDLTLQCTADTRMAPSSWPADTFRYGSLNAVVYQKDLKSPLRTDLTLRYSAASSPWDPVGATSINSTSQNWPLGPDIRAASSDMRQATIAKTDRWDATVLGPDMWTLDTVIAMLYTQHIAITPDQGISFVEDPENNPFGIPASLSKPTYDPDHGRRMPGFDQPYSANSPQPFTGYISEVGAFQARWLPLTDIDDNGQVNPFSLLRVQAFATPDASEPVASTDAVQTAGRDFHCRECHALGKIGANPDAPWQAGAASYSVWNADKNKYGAGPDELVKPVFYDAIGPDGLPSTNFQDQELAALANMANLHAFYDGISDGWFGDFRTVSHNINGIWLCSEHCHGDNSKLQLPFPTSATGSPDPEAVTPLPTKSNYSSYSYSLNYSMNMHRWHGQLQYNDSKDGLLRDANGVPQRWDPLDHPGETNTRTLFPVRDPASGAILPMEQNCLKCHAGQREQCYRDRMYTAGVTCYQCHGDMQAVGMAYLKKQPGSDGHALRQDSIDQPDCGSCHVGSANVGRNNPQEFFSAGVRTLAFDRNDPSATTLPVDWSNPDAARFAVPPTTLERFNTKGAVDNMIGVQGYLNDITRSDGPLYRLGKDTHGNVPCGACHGGAHAVWPNRDPNANDNVTALQLQGHVGQILECNVCHDENAFKKETDLDGGIYMTSLLPDSGVLGGPHNTHPINDPYWYKDAQDPTDTNHAVSQSDGTTYGGWHNNYAQKPGAAGEDQCAACHGHDHKGTRLSRTPVDRVFDFSGFDLKKLKKAGFKTNVIRVAAGTAIGCNTCHSIPTSCRNSPVSTACGKPSDKTTPSMNQPPVFAHEPGVEATTFIFGESPLPYVYTPTVTDPDGDASSLHFGLGTRLDTMSIDPKTGKVSLPNWDDLTVGAYAGFGYGLPYTYTYIVTVNDGRGGYASQKVPVTVTCPAGKVWGYDAAAKKTDCVTNQPPSLRLLPFPTGVVGQPFTYSILSNDPDRSGTFQSPIYELSGQPDGMIVGRTTGLISWVPSAIGIVSFNIKASDQAGGSDNANVAVHVCGTGETWFEGQSLCVANQPPTITSSMMPDGQILGATAGTPFTFTVTATDPDGDTPSFALYGAPDGMTVDSSTGMLSWTPGSDQARPDYPWYGFTLLVSDGRGGYATETVSYFGVCNVGQAWQSEMAMCMDPAPAP